MKPCTCHPDDNPPRPCPRKCALSECRAAAEVEKMDDDILLPPPKYMFDATLFPPLYTADEVRAAIKADRERREESEKVHREVYGVFDHGDGLGPRITEVMPGHQPVTPWLYTFTVCFTSKRAWIDSERNRELARWLRRRGAPLLISKGSKYMLEAADALDGGNTVE